MPTRRGGALPAAKKEPFFKPDFSPDLLLSTNYIGRPWCARPALLRRCGITPSGLEKMGEHHVVLRCTEQATSVHHVPKLLCSRGVDALDSKEASVIALTLAAERGGVEAEVLPGAVPGTWRLKRTQVAQGKVSIIIPTCAAHGHIETCIKTLRARTAYRNFEIICIDNIPAEQAEWKAWVAANADRVVELPEAFNWSRFNNRAMELADGDFLLFLNDDIEVTHEGWLDALLEHAQRPEVGVVGPQLLYPDGKVQHAGMFLADPGIGRHAFRFAAADDPGYFGLALTQRNVIAVTGACMLVRRSLFEELGGFDEAHEVVNNDLDFCLRVHCAGKQTIYTPYASLIHHELASRDRLADVCDLSHFESRWKTLFAAGDPYFSPLLSRESDDYRPDNEPVQTVYAGHPLFKRQEIRRILVVKLDHIGDFITALPAVRRLKRLFPGASISVLAAPASRTLAAVEPTIDEFLDFEFFHARSSLGRRELGRDDWAALEQRLGAYGFDLAVDLRKQPDTREVLKHTGARHLAGFDFLGQFPFLDISLEWEGDRVLHRKRSHVADDLMTLVAAIEVACEPDRLRLMFPIRERSLGFLPREARELFGRTVVAVHPGVGNEMRRWPPEHFAMLIDLLIERNGVNVVLVGGPDEAELADQVMTQIQQRKGVTSCAGKTSLRDLPVLLSACALYIGNNSGPKHIAAALGVPTIGIHSGVVDAVEWGPLGERAVALQRNMSCSPCYLARAEDCSRALACLRLLDPAAVHRTAEMLLARPLTRLPEVAPGQTAVRLQRLPRRAARGTVSAGSLASLAARAPGS